MRAFVLVRHRISLLASGLALLFGASAARLGAQSLTSGSLRGTVQSADGAPIAGATVTIESRGGMAVATRSTNRAGGFMLQLVSPGEYRVLAEQIGFQPVRTSGIVVTPGAATVIVITLQPKPPPVTTIEEATSAGARAGGATGVLVTGNTLGAFDRPLDLSGTAKFAPVVIGSGDGRDGLGIGSSGLVIAETRLFVDGVWETLLRHPGLRAEPAMAPVFSRQGLNQVQFLGPASDLEWRGGPGTLVAAETRTGGGKLTVAPYATFSTAKLGQNKLDNPGDSSGTSFQVGAVLSASIVPDTAHLLIEGAYESLQQPTANPWALDSTHFDGQAGSLRLLVPAIGSDSFNTSLGRFAAPTVRSWKGGHGQARLDWQLGERNRLQARLGYAAWNETNPLLGADLFAGTGSKLKAHDLSAAAGITTSGAAMANEFRLGVNLARREWTSAAVAGTLISGEGIAFGSSPALPGTFDQKRVDLSDAIQYSAGQHRIKGGLALDFTSYEQSYHYAADGLFLFGDLTQFANGTGTFMQVTAPGQSAKFTSSSPGFFLQDTWAASSEIQVQGGLRYDTQILPKSKISVDTAWVSATGIANDYTPKYRGGISPRGSFLWNMQGRGEWIIRGSGGLYRGELDPALFAEAMLFDGAAKVQRAQGTFPGWPALPGAAVTSSSERLTLFAPSYKSPRTAKFDLGIARGIKGGTMVSVAGSYGHTDFLLRRQDLNRPDASGRSTQDGRPVFGTLVQQGGLVTAAPGSNHRFDKFDLVSGLAPTGYVDHYEVTATIEHHATRGLTLDASYTYGKTNDNLVGLLAADPADQLDPFPGGLPGGGGDWSAGRSDLDVPHRVAASAQYRTTGKTPIAVGARWRWRSGLPFTPGFRPGVDLNADGGGNNDPVFVDPALESTLSAAGCSVVAGGFAERNSCRGKSVQALDLSLSVGLPVTISGGGSLRLTIDGFNIMSSKTGIVDRAMLLIDPAQSLSSGGNGRVTVPFVLNTNFGSLLSRRVESRLIRFGLRMEY